MSFLTLKTTPVLTTEEFLFSQDRATDAWLDGRSNDSSDRAQETFEALTQSSSTQPRQLVPWRSSTEPTEHLSARISLLDEVTFMDIIPPPVQPLLQWPIHSTNETNLLRSPSHDTALFSVFNCGFKAQNEEEWKDDGSPQNDNDGEGWKCSLPPQLYCADSTCPRSSNGTGFSDERYLHKHMKKFGKGGCGRLRTFYSCPYSTCRFAQFKSFGGFSSRKERNLHVNTHVQETCTPRRVQQWHFCRYHWCPFSGGKTFGGFEKQSQRTLHEKVHKQGTPQNPAKLRFLQCAPLKHPGRQA